VQQWLRERLSMLRHTPPVLPALTACSPGGGHQCHFHREFWAVRSSELLVPTYQTATWLFIAVKTPWRPRPPSCHQPAAPTCWITATTKVASRHYIQTLRPIAVSYHRITNTHSYTWYMFSMILSPNVEGLYKPKHAALFTTGIKIHYGHTLCWWWTEERVSS
jgi:hypothetical protein